MSWPTPPWSAGPPGPPGPPGGLVLGTTVVESDTWDGNIPIPGDYQVTLTQSQHLFPWTNADVEDEPFGRAQALVLPVGFGAHVNVEPEPFVAPNLWYLRIYKLDPTGVVTGSVDVPTAMSGFSAISTMTGEYTARIMCSAMTNAASRTNEVVDVDFSGATPVVTGHTANAPNGPGLASYSAGIGANYFPDDDITVYTYYGMGVMKGTAFLSETAPYPIGSGKYQIFGFEPTLAEPMRFPYVVFMSFDNAALTADIVVGEAIVDPIGTISYNSRHFCTVPQTNGDIYWIRPISLRDSTLTVLERLMDGEGFFELGWQVNTYELTTGTFVQTLAEVREPVDKPQYLAMNPDVQFLQGEDLLVFADKGPDWGTNADWGDGTLHPGFEREVLYYRKGASDLSSVLAPRPTGDGHGEMDSLTSRSTGGTTGPGAWAMVSAMTDLYDQTGHYYAADFWTGGATSVGGVEYRSIHFRDWAARPYVDDGSPYPAILPGTVNPMEPGWYQIRWQLHMGFVGIAPSQVRFDQYGYHERELLPISHGVGLVADRVVVTTLGTVSSLLATYSTTIFYTPGADTVGSGIGTGIDPYVFFPFGELEYARLVGEVTGFSAYNPVVPV